MITNILVTSYYPEAYNTHTRPVTFTKNVATAMISLKIVHKNYNDIHIFLGTSVKSPPLRLIFNFTKSLLPFPSVNL